MAQITESQVAEAEADLIAAKKARGTAKSGAKFDAYLEAADRLTEVRTVFRAQEESAGRRVGFVNTEGN